ncbi:MULTISPECIES: hypothetical protein [Calothrix]|uniref:Uncharacterized protein n=2 Tax=Calothrix TaxID=1186 RepID=A0ABR8A8L1_9CYAN|nr:hypothetical protein [Calothrix parietina]MBD2195386.1 hypothetical protein [Calothrix parietina FACHB-288]MBD2223985.1 hypothetical protein [Calothrix anomala FACHB-343]
MSNCVKSSGNYGNITAIRQSEEENSRMNPALVGWVERSETQQIAENVGFRSSTQPTRFKVFDAN